MGGGGGSSIAHCLALSKQLLSLKAVDRFQQVLCVIALQPASLIRCALFN